ncbi:hypothetical protein ACHAWF_017290 [Thalassiosira exigua]
MVEHSSLRFRFDSFEKLPCQPGTPVSSADVTDSYGNVWSVDVYPGGKTKPVDIYPGGQTKPAARESNIAVFLFNKGERMVEGKASFFLRDSAGDAFCRECDDDINCYVPFMKGFGFDLPIKRSEIIDKSNNVLNDGALVVDAVLQITNKRYDECIQSNPRLKNMLALLESREGSDVTFKVGDSMIHAHKLILRMNAPILFKFCEKHADEGPIVIRRTSAKVFRIVLHYIYGGDTFDQNSLKIMGKEIIEAANLYGVIDLKIAAEIALGESLVINMFNVVDWLLFSHEKQCDLLKEYATTFFVARATDLLSLESSENLWGAPDLMDELMVALARDRDMYKDRIKMATTLYSKPKLSDLLGEFPTEPPTGLCANVTTDVVTDVPADVTNTAGDVNGDVAEDLDKRGEASDTQSFAENDSSLRSKFDERSGSLVLIGEGVRMRYEEEIYAVALYSDEQAKASISSNPRACGIDAIQTLHQALENSSQTAFLLKLSIQLPSQQIMGEILDIISPHIHSNTTLASIMLLLYGAKKDVFYEGTTFRFDCINSDVELSIDDHKLGHIGEVSKSLLNAFLSNTALGPSLHLSVTENCSDIEASVSDDATANISNKSNGTTKTDIGGSHAMSVDGALTELPSEVSGETGSITHIEVPKSLDTMCENITTGENDHQADCLVTTAKEPDKSQAVKYFHERLGNVLLLGNGVRERLGQNVYSMALYSDEQVKDTMHLVPKVPKENAIESLCAALKRSSQSTLLLELTTEMSSQEMIEDLLGIISSRVIDSTTLENINNVMRADGKETLTEGTDVRFDCTDQGVYFTIDGKELGGIPGFSTAFLDTYLSDAISPSMIASVLDYCCNDEESRSDEGTANMGGRLVVREGSSNLTVQEIDDMAAFRASWCIGCW